MQSSTIQCPFSDTPASSPVALRSSGSSPAPTTSVHPRPSTNLFPTTSNAIHLSTNKRDSDSTSSASSIRTTSKNSTTSRCCTSNHLLIRVALHTVKHLHSNSQNNSSEDDLDLELLPLIDKTTQKTLNHTYLREEAGLASGFRFKQKDRVPLLLHSKRVSKLNS